VPVLTSNSYRIQVKDGSNLDLGDSSAIPLWTDVRQYITTPQDAPSANSQSQDNGTADNGTAAPDSPSAGPESPTSGGCGTAGYTWATEGVWDGTHISDHDNILSEDEGSLTDIAVARPWTWGYANDCGYSQVGDQHYWGLSDGHEGQSVLHGRATPNFGFAVSYSGGTRDGGRQCNGLTCEWVGYEIVASNARSFMKTPANVGASPATVGTSTDGIWGVSIPQSSGVSPAIFAHAALDGLSLALDGWGGAILTALGYTVPDSALEFHQWDGIRTAVDGSAGAGIIIHPPVSQGQQVEGVSAWNFSPPSPGTYKFSWTMESAVDMHASFHACVGCSWAGNDYTIYPSAQHQAELIVAS